jgi:sulfofructose kinase
MSSSPANAVNMLCVGHVALDMMFHVEQFPAFATKTSASDFISGVGGMSGNAAVAAARLGAKVCFAGPVGDDAAAQTFEQHFKREGVDCSRMVRLSGTTSSVSAIIVDSKGERYIFNRRGDALKQPPPFDANWLDEITVLTADPRCPVWCETALSLARQRKVISIFDGDIAPSDDLRRLVPLSEWAVFSQEGLQIFAPGGRTVDMALRTAVLAGATVAAVTQGDQGVWWLRAGGQVQHLPAIAIKAVDTTGAGDVFHAALGVALAEGQTDADAIGFAAFAAALKCKRVGGVLGAPNRQEVDLAIQTAKVKSSS